MEGGGVEKEEGEGGANKARGFIKEEEGGGVKGEGLEGGEERKEEEEKGERGVKGASKDIATIQRGFNGFPRYKRNFPARKQHMSNNTCLDRENRGCAACKAVRRWKEKRNHLMWFL